MTGTEKFDKLAPDIIASSENVEKKEAKAKQTSDGFSGLWKPQSEPNPILFCDFILTDDVTLVSGMKEVTTKVLGNEPDLLVSTGCRSKLNAGTDDEMTITGYRLVR